MDLQALQEKFLEIYKSKITREGSDELLEYLQSSDFLYAPASTRYHANYPGGLLEHSLNVYECLLSEVEHHGMGERHSGETLAIVALMHDLCKANMYKKGTRNVKENGVWVQKEVYEIDELTPIGHSEKSVIMLQNFIRLSIEEIYAIRAHMGAWDSSVQGGARFIGQIFEKCELAVLLHVADMKATYLMEGRDE